MTYVAHVCRARNRCVTEFELRSHVKNANLTGARAQVLVPLT